ncbi:MAG: sulfate reduction electron transfer complex DsrMKJOP subunit DsrM [Gammaproteobacteria bacterium]|nr:MAG: sulfate reduction electron transfer complex DsrMKJOP subunit DsrM [Gammaproteobacteria bacterium]
MSAVTLTYGILFYLATIVLIVGVVFKIIQYTTTPAPLKIATTPAPISMTGVVWRITKEVTIFASLFKSSKWTWIFGWMFHLALLLAFFRHLRYVMSPDFFLLPIISLNLVQAVGKYASFAMLAGLIGLFGRRMFVDRVRYISSPSDYLMLLLLFSIAGTGMLMVFVLPTDIIMLKAFVLSLYMQPFRFLPLPADVLVLTHLALVILLMLIFPVSKLLHAPGVFFSPTRNQVDNPREHRHIQGWTADDTATSKPV